MKKFHVKKINSVFFGYKMILASFIIGGVVPLILWFIMGKIIWPFVIIGGIILLSFIIIFAIEMRQDFGKTPYYEYSLKDTIPYDPINEYAVIKNSICTGEKLAGFKDRQTGKFTEVMLIENQDDLERFKRIYGIEEVKDEY